MAETPEPVSAADTSSRVKLIELHEAHNNLASLHNDAIGRINVLERRVDKLGSDSGSDTSSNASDDDDYQLGYEENVIPEVRTVDFEHFKNRYSEKDGKYCIEVLCAASDLGNQVRQELKRRGELTEYDDGPNDTYEGSSEKYIHRVRIQSPSILFLLSYVLRPDDDPWKGQNRTTFYRPFAWLVHAHSKMKEHLEDLEERFRDEGSLTREERTQTIADLVISLAHDTSNDDQDIHVTNDLPVRVTGPEQSEEGLVREARDESVTKSLAKRVDRKVLERALLESYQTLLALRCYVNLIDEQILPDAMRYRNQELKDPTIRYHDLWNLFQPGELIYINQPPPPQVGASSSKPVQVVKLARIEKPSAAFAGRYSLYYLSCMPRAATSADLVAQQSFTLVCYTLDFNGDYYGATPRYFVIPFFTGVRDIVILPAFPLRFHPASDELLSSLQGNGRKFVDAVEMKHMAYDGWSMQPPLPPPPKAPYHPPGRGRPPGSAAMSTLPPGVMNGPPRRMVAPQAGDPVPGRPIFPPDDALDERPLPDFNGETSDSILQKVTYIESDVIVDFKEAIRTSPHWRPQTYQAGPLTDFAPPGWEVVREKLDIIRWADRRRKTRLSSILDRTLASDGIARILQHSGTTEYRKPGKSPDFDPHELALLPPRIYAYALRERKFFSGDIQCLGKITSEIDPFASLKIQESHVKILQSVVSSHFQRKALESASMFVPHLHQDLIRGKGRGLVILLHGAPGVGKTATAEAVAMWHKKPLFLITCGDLGFTPEGVEQSLGEIFRLAHMWDCILLLDEADVFLSQRETNALQRNALVSVFLRVLEYYNGILFLTTNRVGTLDEAFKSRVHLSLFYPPLDRTQTMQIMQMNLNRLKLIEKQRAEAASQKPLLIYDDEICQFVAEHWDKHINDNGEGRWNGRQIRNAVQIAASIALYDRQKDVIAEEQGLPPMLRKEQFITVEETMTSFEVYMNSTRGGNAAFIAKQRSERDDTFRGGRSTRDTRMHQSISSGGYSPYPNTAQTPPSTLSQPHQPQHLSPSGSTYGYHHGMSPGQPYGQGEAWRPAPSGASPFDPSASFGGRPPPQSGTHFDPRG